MLLELLQVQLGSQVDFDTLISPTAKLMGIEDCTIRPVVETKRFKDRRQSLAPAYLSALTKAAGEGEISGLLLYEDSPYWLDNLFGEATPTGSDPYTYAHAAPLTVVPASPRILSLVYGGADGVYGLTGGMLNGLTVSGRTGEALRFSGPLIGKAVATDTLESLSDRTVNVVMADHVALYIDAWGGAMGATQITSVFWEFELNVEPNRSLVFGMGSLSPAEYKESSGEGWEGSLKMKLKFDATTKAFLDALIGASAVFQKQVRIKATAGTKVAQLDFAGTAEQSPELFDDEEGLIVLEFELAGEYNSALTNWLKTEVVNGVATLP